MGSRHMWELKTERKRFWRYSRRQDGFIGMEPEPPTFPEGWRPDMQLGPYRIHGGCLPRYGYSGVLLKLYTYQGHERRSFAAKLLHSRCIERPMNLRGRGDVKAKLSEESKRIGIQKAVMNYLSCKAHPNVCLLHDVLRDSKHQPVYVLPWAELGSMRDWVETLDRVRGTLAPRIDACVQGAAGIEHLHNAAVQGGEGITHGDIRLESLLVFSVEKKKAQRLQGERAVSRTGERKGNLALKETQSSESGASSDGTGTIDLAAAAAGILKPQANSSGVGLRVIVRVGMRVPGKTSGGSRRRVRFPQRFWRAPETRRSGGGYTAGKASDVWGMALCVLWTLSETGRDAVYRVMHTSAAVRSRVVEGLLPSPLRSRLGPVLSACLKDDPKDRPSITQLHEALRTSYRMVSGRDPKLVRSEQLSSKNGPLGDAFPDPHHRLGWYYETVLSDLKSAAKCYGKVVGDKEKNKIAVPAHIDLLRSLLKDGGSEQLKQACELYYYVIRPAEKKDTHGENSYASRGYVSGAYPEGISLFSMACQYSSPKGVDQVAWWLAEITRHISAKNAKNREDEEQAKPDPKDKTSSKRISADTGNAENAKSLEHPMYEESTFSKGILRLWELPSQYAILGAGLRAAAEKGRTDIVDIILREVLSSERRNMLKDAKLSKIDLDVKGVTERVQIDGGKVTSDKNRISEGEVQRVLNHQAKEGSTAMVLASKNGHHKVILQLLAAKADPKMPNHNQVTPLLRAAESGSLKVVQILLENKADPHLSEKNGYTPLITAAQNGHAHICRLLLELQADPTKPKKDGGTALMVAAFQGYKEVSRLLLDSKADPSAVALGGFSATDVTRSSAVKSMLESYDGAENLKRLTEFRRTKLNEWTQRHVSSKKGKRLKPSQKHDTFVELCQWMDRQCLKARCKMEVQRSAMNSGLPSSGSGLDSQTGHEKHLIEKDSTTNVDWKKKELQTQGVIVCNRSNTYTCVIETYSKGTWTRLHVLTLNQERILRENQRCVVFDSGDSDTLSAVQSITDSKALSVRDNKTQNLKQSLESNEGGKIVVHLLSIRPKGKPSRTR